MPRAMKGLGARSIHVAGSGIADAVLLSAHQVRAVMRALRRPSRQRRSGIFGEPDDYPQMPQNAANRLNGSTQLQARSIGKPIAARITRGTHVVGDPPTFFMFRRPRRVREQWCGRQSASVQGPKRLQRQSRWTR